MLINSLSTNEIDEVDDDYEEEEKGGRKMM
jgi:hypothetical protein